MGIINIPAINLMMWKISITQVISFEKTSYSRSMIVDIDMSARYVVVNINVDITAPPDCFYGVTYYTTHNYCRVNIVLILR